MAPPVLRKARSLGAIIRRPPQPMAPYLEFLEDSFVGSPMLISGLIDWGRAPPVPVIGSYADEVRKLYDLDFLELDGKDMQTILKQIEVAERGQRFPDGKSRKVRLDGGRLVKYGGRVSRREALAMQFVRRYSSVPVPRVQAFFEHNKARYIVMDHVEGSTLSNLFSSLSQEALHSISLELGDLVNKLQSIPRPFACRLGTWPEGPYNNTQVFSPPPPRSLFNVHEFNKYWFCQWLLSERWYKRTMLEEPHYPWLARLEAETYSVFGHGDLGPTNIMVKDGRIVSLLDWETAGWYPHWWEFVQMRLLFRYPNVPPESPLVETFLHRVRDRSLLAARVGQWEHEDISRYGDWVYTSVTSILK